MRLNPQAQHRVLVTGSRGKSSIVRLLHAAMNAQGIKTYARITGVVPRELNPDGIRTISRSAGAHVKEMRWWLGKLPAGAQGVVMENSAINAEFQGLAGRWLQPQITVLSNTVPDHQELWGPGSDNAAGVLAGGIPKHGKVVITEANNTDPHLLNLLSSRHCEVVVAQPASLAGEDFKRINLGLAHTVIEQLGLATEPALQTMLAVEPDHYDFHIANHHGVEMAMAFSANDITSTRALFHSLNWSPDETHLLYNHRADRPGRFKSFISWLNRTGWKDVFIIGDKPRKCPDLAQFLDIKTTRDLIQLFQPGDRIFGCGNLAGLPLSLCTALG